MKLLSLFSGIGAFEKAISNIGVDYELVGFSEIDKWAIESYCAIHGVDKSLNLGDVSKIKNEDLPKEVDMVTYGFPCQDISVAGQLKGINESTRSGLLYEAERVIQVTKPKYAIAENVKNLVGKKFKNDFDELLKRLDDYGYNNYWKVLNAKDYGIPQNRERVFIVSIRKDIDSNKFEFPKPFELELRLKDMLDFEFDKRYIIDNDRSNELLQILDSKGLLDENNINEYSTNKCNMVGKLNMKGHDQLKRVYNPSGLSPTLTTMGGGNTEPKVVVKENTKKCNQAVLQTIKIDNSIKPSVAKNFEREKENISKSEKEIYQCKCESGWQDNKVGLKVSPTLRAANSHTSVLDNNYVIRKLTPLECWRLMGFEDEDYWKARRRLEKVFYNGNDRSNSQMYKQAGNSIVVNVLEYIFINLLKEEIENELE